MGRCTVKPCAARRSRGRVQAKLKQLFEEFRTKIAINESRVTWQVAEPHPHPRPFLPSPPAEITEDSGDSPWDSDKRALGIQNLLDPRS